MDKNKKAYIYAGLATLFWSTMAAAFKMTLPVLQYNIIRMLFFSNLISLIALLFLLWKQRKLYLLGKMPRKDILTSAVLGFLNPFAYYLVLFKAYSLLPGQIAGPLNYTWPIILTLLSVPFLNQKIHFYHLIALMVSFSGVLVISTQGRPFSFQFVNLIGVLLAVGSSVIWALFWIGNLRDKRDSVVKLFVNLCFGFVYILILFVLTDNGLPPWQGFAGLIWIGCFEMGFTFVLWLTALKLADRTATISNLVYFSPLLALFFLQTIAGERILLSSFFGLILIVFGIFIQAKKEFS